MVWFEGLVKANALEFEICHYWTVVAERPWVRFTVV